MNLPGYGDPITWGAITSRNDPRYQEFVGRVTFPMTLGLQGGRVTVIADANECELDDILEVLYGGIDILPILDVDQHQDIRSHYERHALAIQQSQKGDDD